MSTAIIIYPSSIENYPFSIASSLPFHRTNRLPRSERGLVPPYFYSTLGGQLIHNTYVPITCMESCRTGEPQAKLEMVTRIHLSMQDTPQCKAPTVFQGLEPILALALRKP